MELVRKQVYFGLTKSCLGTLNLLRLLRGNARDSLLTFIRFERTPVKVFESATFGIFYTAAGFKDFTSFMTKR